MLAFMAACAAVAIDSRPTVAENCDDAVAAACTCCEPRWSVTAGSIFLNRSPARPGTLVVDGTTEAELVNVADFDLGWAAGPEVELSRHLDCGWDVAVRYFGIDGWNTSRSLADTGNLQVPLVSNNPNDFFDTASASYASRLYSTELNLKRRWGEQLRVLAGFRYVELLEKISAEAFSPRLEGTFDISGANYLYGFQLGAESVLYEHGPLQFEGYLKAGVYGNHIRGNLYGDGTNFHLDDSATASHTSFLGEIGLTANYQFSEHCSAFGGYQVMWLQGVVLAGDFVSSLVSSSSDFDLFDGAAFYHGARMGLQFNW